MPLRGRVPSVDASRFSMVPRGDVPRSAFDVRHGHKTTFNAGLLVPVYCWDILPGDSMKLDMTAFCRLSTPLVPMMDNLELESYFFFVPNRLVWDNWARFMGEKAGPSDTTTFLVPQVQIVNGDLTPGASAADYFGITVNGSGNTLNVNALPFRGMNLIYNEWFRDQNVDPLLTVPTGDGPDTYNGTYFLQRVRKRHDYFTSALPWPEKGLNIQSIPSANPQDAGALANGFPSQYNPFGQAGVPVIGIGVNDSAVTDTNTTIRNTANRRIAADYFSTSVRPFYIRNAAAGNYPDIRVMIQDIRTANMVQLMLEKNARGGTRYTELIRSHFGVVSPDARLQRPEYLGGGRTMIQVNPVAQTSASGVAGTTTKLGELAAIGSGMVHGHGFSQSFTEHGFVLGFVCIKSFLTYQSGVERFWYRRTQFDHYFPGLAHLGEQAIQKQELYADGSATDPTVFGYQERWSEYKWRPSRTSGYFRSTVATPLDMWHLGQKFTAAPALNSTFLEENPPISRVLQVATNFGEDFLFDGLFDARMVRCMPVHSIPGLGDRL